MEERWGAPKCHDDMGASANFIQAGPAAESGASEWISAPRRWIFQICSVHWVIFVLIGRQLQRCFSNLQQWAKDGSAITLYFGALGLVLQTGAIHEIHSHTQAGAEVVMQHARQSKALGIRVTESAAVRLTSSSVLNAHCNETSVLSHPPESAGHSFSGETAQRPPRLTGPPVRDGKKARAANCSRYGNHKIIESTLWLEESRNRATSDPAAPARWDVWPAEGVWPPLMFAWPSEITVILSPCRCTKSYDDTPIKPQMTTLVDSSTRQQCFVGYSGCLSRNFFFFIKSITTQ